jgi:hypothetical protein
MDDRYWQAYTAFIMWSSGPSAALPKLRVALLCAGLWVALASLREAPGTEVIFGGLGAAMQDDANAVGRKLAGRLPGDAPVTVATVTTSDSVAAVRKRWDAMWSTDVAAAEVNVANWHNTASLIRRADHGDLEATVDLVGAATWCLSGGPLTNITDSVNDERRPCFERFGVDLASRERLERASFMWVVRLAAAGIDDATLYASALTRGVGPDLLGGPDNEPDIGDDQRALLVGQLQALAERGSADAASELHGHWSGRSAFGLADERLTRYYAELTEQLDPTRSLALVAQ